MQQPCSSLDLPLGCWSPQYLIVCLLTSNSYVYFYDIQNSSIMSTKVSPKCCFKNHIYSDTESLHINQPFAFRFFFFFFPLLCLCLCHSQALHHLLRCHTESHSIDWRLYFQCKWLVSEHYISTQFAHVALILLVVMYICSSSSSTLICVYSYVMLGMCNM